LQGLRATGEGGENALANLHFRTVRSKLNRAKETYIRRVERGRRRERRSS